MLSRFVLQSTSRRVAIRSCGISSFIEGGSPSAKDLFINLTIVDPDGARKNIKGLIGKTLHDACLQQGIDLGPSIKGGPFQVRRTPTWVEDTYGEGVTKAFDHVVLTGKGADAVDLPPTRVEKRSLQELWEEEDLFEGSRSASAITLNKKMDGMVVYVPERIDAHALQYFEVTS